MIWSAIWRGRERSSSTAKIRLPLPELQVVLLDVQHSGSRQMDGFVVGMSVSAFTVAHIDGADFEIIVRVLISPGRQFFQKLLHVGDQKRLSFIDDDGHGRVQALDIDDTVHNAGSLIFSLIFSVTSIKSSVVAVFSLMMWLMIFIDFLFLKS